jgi:hypothetical protein
MMKGKPETYGTQSVGIAELMQLSYGNSLNIEKKHAVRPANMPT